MRLIVCLRDLLLEQIGDLYEAELQQLKVLPILRDKASACELKELMERLHVETEAHVVRLDRVLTYMQDKPTGEVCIGMQSLLDRALALCDQCVATHVMDAAIITAIQHLIHYEIAGYGAACSFANSLNAHELASLLYETLEEVKGMDKLLSDLATEKINVKANTTTQEASETREMLGVIFDGY